MDIYTKHPDLKHYTHGLDHFNQYTALDIDGNVEEQLTLRDGEWYDTTKEAQLKQQIEREVATIARLKQQEHMAALKAARQSAEEAAEGPWTDR